MPSKGALGGKAFREHSGALGSCNWRFALAKRDAFPASSSHAKQHTSVQAINKRPCGGIAENYGREELLLTLMG